MNAERGVCRGFRSIECVCPGGPGSADLMNPWQVHRLPAAAVNLFDVLRGGHLAGTTPMPSTVIDTGPQRVVHRYEPNNGAATHSAPGGHLGVLTGRQGKHPGHHRRVSHQDRWRNRPALDPTHHDPTHHDPTHHDPTHNDPTHNDPTPTTQGARLR